jgi:hypothetical protein
MKSHQNISLTDGEVVMCGGARARGRPVRYWLGLRFYRLFRRPWHDVLSKVDIK